MYEINIIQLFNYLILKNAKNVYVSFKYLLNVLIDSNSALSEME